MKGWLQYAAVWLLLKGLGLLPRPLARWVAAKVAVILYTLSPKLRKTAETNLRMAFQEWTETQRDAVIRKMVRNLGWMAAEFALLRPELVLCVGKLAIGQFLRPVPSLNDVISRMIPAERWSHRFDLAPLPHPSGASPSLLS